MQTTLLRNKQGIFLLTLYNVNCRLPAVQEEKKGEETMQIDDHPEPHIYSQSLICVVLSL